MVDILINKTKIKCLCDSGAEINLLPADFAEKKKHCLSLKPVNGVQPVSVDQAPVRCADVTVLRIVADRYDHK